MRGVPWERTLSVRRWWFNISGNVPLFFRTRIDALWWLEEARSSDLGGGTNDRRGLVKGVNAGDTPVPEEAEEEWELKVGWR